MTAGLDVVVGAVAGYRSPTGTADRADTATLLAATTEAATLSSLIGDER
ncbi:hypothetical protein AB0M54_33780 [Actinoplanes sp. NPDC051470]